MNKVILTTYGGPKCIQPLSQVQDTSRWLATRRVTQADARRPYQSPLEWSPWFKSCVEARLVQYMALRTIGNQVEWRLTWSVRVSVGASRVLVLSALEGPGADGLA